ncbi:cupin domain-containing protein [Verminephrobacter aporrectodeae]|uniref:cupin domain-containing protein n=1 Tax=Verminephrobacter aporrectodeae TaxID=1110389 RepID=UPI002243223B|nr:cupin domain-containing protein [Verminephrobacter aporrectodeae]
MQDTIEAQGIERLIRRNEAASFTNEYNCKLRRLFPWTDAVNTKRQITEFGVIWVVVDPSTAVDRHSHDEEETFIVVGGEAELTVGDEKTIIRHGDVIYLPRFSEHQLRNLSPSIPFAMIDIYWDWAGKSDATLR